MAEGITTIHIAPALNREGGSPPFPTYRATAWAGDPPDRSARAQVRHVAAVNGNVIIGVVMAIVFSGAGSAIFGWYGYSGSGRRRLMKAGAPPRIVTPTPAGVRAHRRMSILVCQVLCVLLAGTAVGTVVAVFTGSL